LAQGRREWGSPPGVRATLACPREGGSAAWPRRRRSGEGAGPAMAPSSTAGSTAAASNAGPGLERSVLLKKCVQIIDSYDPKKTTVDAFIQDTPVLKDKRLSEIEAKFIHQVFYGCTRYGKFLKLFVTSFLYKCPTVAIRADQSLYMVLGYMLFFRIEELGIPEFRQMVNSGLGTQSALLALLQYAMSVEELEKWVKVEWCKVYDVAYIENDIIGKLQSYIPELRPVVAEIEFKATGTVKDAADATMVPVREKRMTEAKPFNLTQPKPRLIPEPEVISRVVKATPVPTKMIHGTSLAAVEEEKQRRLEEEKSKIATKYSPDDHFQLETAKRTDVSKRVPLEDVAKSVEHQVMKHCTFQPMVKEYMPPTMEAVVRQNTSAVLREDSLLKKKQLNEYQVLKRYEEDLHDASDFHRWQQDMKEKDSMDEEKRVQQRIVEMQLARESAIEAMEGMHRKKTIIAAQHKEDMEGEIERKKQELEIELHGKQELVQEVQAERVNGREAFEQVLRQNAEKAEQMRREAEAEFERKKREDEQEMERRRDLIRQIRALEKVPVERFKAYDRAEQPCQGLLEEMSYAELQERLKIVTTQHAKETDDRRERQLKEKLEKQHELKEKAETLVKIRERSKSESQARHAQMKQRKVQVEDMQKRYREQCTVEVAERIQQKKKEKLQEEIQLKKELKEISVKRQFLSANADMVEAKSHAEQHAGLEREANRRQHVGLHEQRRKDVIVARDAITRRAVKEDLAQEYKVMQDAVNDRISRAKASDALLKTEIMKASMSARNSQFEIARRQRDEIGHSSNKYMQKVTQRMATSA